MSGELEPLPDRRPPPVAPAPVLTAAPVVPAVPAVPAAPVVPATPDEPPAPSGRASFGGLVRVVSGVAVDLTDAARFVGRRLTGQAPTDVFGYDAELTDAVLAPLLRPLARSWFHVDVQGLEHVPADGAALVAANHSGVLPWDALMIALAVHDREPAGRALRLLGADLLFTLPVLGELARRGGATLASVDDAEALLAAGELVGVFPEGFRGIGKPYSERYRLQRFGRGGFVSVALAAGVPIIACAVVGAEGAHPLLADVPDLARLLGWPYFPITPTFPWLGPLGVVPLPGRWTIRFAPPLPTAGRRSEPGIVEELTDQVRGTVQAMIDDIRGPAA